MESIVEKILYKKLEQNLLNLGISFDDISSDTDLLKSGIIDSMEFIELLADIGKETGISIESFLEDDDEINVTISWFIKRFK